MKQTKLTQNNWMVALVILLIVSFGFISQADAKSKRKTTYKDYIEANARASKYVGTAPLRVQFNARRSSTNRGRIVSYVWDFNDGQTQEGKIVNHTFDEPGNYAVTLKVENSKGATDQDTIYIEVKNACIHVDDMSISLLAEDDGSSRARVEVVIKDANGSPIPDVIVIGKWGGLIRGRSAQITDAGGKAVFISKSTDEAGTIKFRVKTAGSAGYKYIHGNDSVQISTDVQANLAPIAEANCGGLCGVAPFNATFCGRQSVDPDGEIVEFKWDYGDGGTGEGITDQHVFEEPGTYFVTLTVKDDDGLTATDEIMITVTGAPE